MQEKILKPKFLSSNTNSVSDVKKEFITENNLEKINSKLTHIYNNEEANSKEIDLLSNVDKKIETHDDCEYKSEIEKEEKNQKVILNYGNICIDLLPEIEYMISYWKEIKTSSDYSLFNKLNEYVLSGFLISGYDMKSLFIFQNTIHQCITNTLEIESFCIDYIGYFIFKIKFKAINLGYSTFKVINISNKDDGKSLTIKVIDKDEKIHYKLNKFGELNIVDSKKTLMDNLEFTYYIGKSESFMLYIVNEPLYNKTNSLSKVR